MLSYLRACEPAEGAMLFVLLVLAAVAASWTLFSYLPRTALRLSDYFSMRSQMRAGAPVGSWILLPGHCVPMAVVHEDGKGLRLALPWGFRSLRCARRGDGFAACDLVHAQHAGQGRLSLFWALGWAACPFSEPHAPASRQSARLRLPQGILQ